MGTERLDTFLYNYCEWWLKLPTFKKLWRTLFMILSKFIIIGWRHWLAQNSEILLLCIAEQSKSYGFGTTWVWVIQYGSVTLGLFPFSLYLSLFIYTFWCSGPGHLLLYACWWQTVDRACLHILDNTYSGGVAHWSACSWFLPQNTNTDSIAVSSLKTSPFPISVFSSSECSKMKI